MVDGEMTCPASGPLASSFLGQCETTNGGTTNKSVAGAATAGGGSSVLVTLIVLVAVGAVAVGAILHFKKKTQVTLGEARASTVMQPVYTSDTYSGVYGYTQEKDMSAHDME